MTNESPASEAVHDTTTQAMPCVLIVDDSRVMRVALSRLLSKTYQVIEAADGEQGWQALLQHPEIELVFSDLSMPVLDGFELLRRIRASDDRAISSMPLVVITGHEDDEGMQRKAAEMGASDFVAKPFRSAEITTRAKSLIGQRRDLRQLRRELDERATLDAATGLADTAHFTAHFDEILSLARRHGLNSACLVVQLDGFPQRGADQPDEQTAPLLRQLAELLRGLIRSEDAAGYLGDGCYGLALSGADRDGARLLAQRLERQLGAMSRPDQPAPAVSIGISSPVSEHTTAAAALIKAAQAHLQPLSVAAAAKPATAVTDPDAAKPQAGAPPEPGAATTGLRQESDPVREALQAAKQANSELTEQLKTLQESTRAQVAKAHQEMHTTRSKLNALQTQFRDYMKRYSQEAQKQAETEIAQLRAALTERDRQLEGELVSRQKAEATLAQLQAKLIAAQAAAEQEEAEKMNKRGGLLSRLFDRS